MEWVPAIIAACFVGFALVSRRLGRSVLTGPIIFTTLGVVLGPEVLDLVNIRTHAGGSSLLLGLTLVIVLFTDANAINSSRWREDAAVAGRLLGIALPLSIAIGTGLALVLLGDLEIWEAAALAAMLAPTDAALGKAVVSNMRVPQRIRQALSVESGLNDGIVLPIFVLFVEAAEASERSAGGTALIRELASEVGIAVVVGMSVGWLGARAIKWAIAANWATGYWLEIALVALAVLAFYVADPLHGSGFIAAWVAGATFGRFRSSETTEIHEFAEATGDTLTMLSFLLFGLIVGPVLSTVTWELALYAALSLAVVRVVAVAISMIGSGLGKVSVLYMGWFGPRGLATLILTVSLVESHDLAGTLIIRDVAMLTVAMSVIAHGLTAWMGSNAYADWISTHPDSDTLAENQPTPDLRTPRRTRIPTAAKPTVLK